jgi:CRP-like cAMP-binding protein
MRKRAPIANKLLATLPPGQNERLFDRLTTVTLPAGAVLCKPGARAQHAYFLNNGLASLLSTTEEGNVIEIGVIGNTGIVGTPIILRGKANPYGVAMSIAGEAMMVEASVLREEFDRGGKLHHMLLRFAHLLLSQLSLLSPCNRFHTVEQRLCRWLLAAYDQTQLDNFQLTQEFIAQNLGVSRPNISLAAGHLQKVGLIRYRRGEIILLNRKGLEEAVCGCYLLLREEMEDFLNG